MGNSLTEMYGKELSKHKQEKMNTMNQGIH